MHRLSINLAWLFAISWGCFPITFGGSDDWPGWRGSDRTDVSPETGLLQEWPHGGPPRKWLFENAGMGYAGFAIVNGRLYTMGADDTHAAVICLDADTGIEIWRQKFAERYTSFRGNGPRGTPTFSNNQLFVLSGNGTVCCLNAADGAIVWRQDLKEFGGSIPRWGYSESVLVDGDQVVCTPGGSEGAIIAFHAKTGQRIWQSSLFTGIAQYSSIIVADHPQRHYIQLTEKSVVGINPENGGLLWRSAWPGRSAVVPTPIVFESKVYVTSGYAVGSMQLDIADLKNVKRLWFNRIMKNQHGGVILLDGFLYGYSDNVGWLCQDWQTGDRVWNEKEALGKGAIAYADGRFYLLAAKTGNVVLIEASPQEWKERGRFQLGPLSARRKPATHIWTHPVISGGHLYLRDQEKIFCFDIKQP